MIRVLLPEVLFLSQPPSFRSAPLRPAPLPQSTQRQTLLSVHHHTVRILVLALRRRQCHSSKGFSGGIYSYLLSPVHGQAVSEPSRTMTPQRYLGLHPLLAAYQVYRTRFAMNLHECVRRSQKPGVVYNNHAGMQNRGTATCDAVAAETISRAGLWPHAAWDPSHRWDE